MTLRIHDWDGLHVENEKNSHNDGGERQTHTSATDPCESGMNGESVHVSSKQHHQGIRTTQHRFEAR